MVDEVDRIVEIDALEREGQIHIALRDAQNIPAGNPGFCLACEEQSPRLVRGHCAPCRDELKLP